MALGKDGKGPIFKKVDFFSVIWRNWSNTMLWETQLSFKLDL